jgi:peptidyl-tRNA hydrolase, PTH1 family
LKIVAGLGNPGPEYDGTRHNVGWWALDRIALDWDFGPYKREGATLVTSGSREGLDVVLLKPAHRPWLGKEGLDPSRDLLVIVDDAALDVGRVRFRPGGSDGGHNGLRSVRETLGSGEFARLRIGVGRPPPGEDLVRWVLSAPEREDEDRILDLLPSLSEGASLWLREGIEPVMNEFNR